MPTDDRTLTLAHSPDPDDAFMWWPLIEGRIDCGFAFEPVRLDIETLNERSLQRSFDITAISCAQYPHVAEDYIITNCGASMGENYGPKLVSRRGMTLAELAETDIPIAVPGLRTTAALLTSMALETDQDRLVPIAFDQVIEAVAKGDFEAGVVIHEGQLTFADAQLHLVADLGAWWYERFELPLPLGLNVIRRDLDERYGPGTIGAIDELQRASIEHALEHRDEAVAYAMQFARGVTLEQADAFVGMYVNRYTLDAGEAGREAVRTVLSKGAQAGLLPETDEALFVPLRTGVV